MGDVDLVDNLEDGVDVGALAEGAGDDIGEAAKGTMGALAGEAKSLNSLPFFNEDDVRRRSSLWCGADMAGCCHQSKLLIAVTV